MGKSFAFLPCLQPRNQLGLGFGSHAETLNFTRSQRLWRDRIRDAADTHTMPFEAANLNHTGA
ncbi:hypothetical protein IQ254_03640 [Nodosilinea sp. LEGE 07088]|uniref:hypothetical protein n=1 Tax=Nodosilinea sp. LEGE 07088 TaxID=2777968 RepID=UPI00187E3042|nr:hypothetical protein [Nodosilinea sp. LEGE 07088]MBE9136302.1 hypothetical protein [Nodosilinea sp. LEGE 07088]